MAEPRRLNDPNAVKTAEQRAQDAALSEVDDLRALMSAPHGRRFVWRLLEKGNVFASVFSANGSQMCFNEGRRQAALELFNMLNTELPELYLTMAREAAAAAKRVA